MSLLNPASAINHVLKPALIFAAVTAQATEAAPPEYYVDAETARSVTYDKDPENTVKIFGTINEEMAEKTIDRLYAIAKRDPDAPIVIEINSKGGETDAGLAILDTINNIPNPVSTICLGTEVSMATIIAIGTKGFNYATEHSRLMLHAPSASSAGDSNEMLQKAGSLQITNASFMDILTQATGLPLEYVEDILFSGDTYMSPEQAVALNLFDGIIPSPKEHPTPKKEAHISEAFCDETRRKMTMCMDRASAHIAPAAQIAEQRDFAGPAAPNP